MWAIRRFASDGEPLYWRGVRGSACWSILLGEAIAFAREKDAKRVIDHLVFTGAPYGFDQAMVRGHDSEIMNRINGR